MLVEHCTEGTGSSLDLEEAFDELVAANTPSEVGGGGGGVRIAPARFQLASHDYVVTASGLVVLLP